MPSMDLDVNPNGSVAGHRGHHLPRRPRASARWATWSAAATGLYANVPGDKFMPIFENGVAYFA